MIEPDSCKVSVLILTRNEEVNLPRCLDSLQWCKDVVVLDSKSTDKTVKIANSYGARVFQREFDNYAAQRNFGLNDIEYNNQWLLMVDADEEVPHNLVAEISNVIQSAEPGVGLYRMRRKDFFQGRWIKHSSGYPTWFGRLIKIGYVRIEREINEEYVTEGKVGLLQHHLRHYPFNKGYSAWLEKHNRYSTMEAELIIKRDLASPRWSELLDKDPACRRRALKGIVYRLPSRPLLMFLALYIFRGGFLDGRAGLVFCLLRSFYEFLINCKVNELRYRDEGVPL